MTKEEAIIVLNNEVPSCWNKICFTESEACEAYYMAISALKEQIERENSNKLQQESIKTNAGKKEELIELLSGYSLDTYEDIVYTAERLIEHGVEIPVRCKDCKHVRKMIGKSYHYCVTHNTKMHADDFCSYGEKRCDDAN